MNDWEEEYKEQYMDYMKDGALFLSVRNFFRRVVIKAKIINFDKAFKSMDENEIAEILFKMYDGHEKTSVIWEQVSQIQAELKKGLQGEK